MKILLFILLYFLSDSGYSQRLSTVFHEDYSQWRFEGNTIKTDFRGKNDAWNYNNIRIKTVFSDDLNHWKINNSVDLKTVFHGDFSTWEISGHDLIIRIRTTFMNDAERWAVSGDIDGTINTIFSDNYEHWDIDVDFLELHEDLKIAIVFIAIQEAIKHNK